jgi:ribosomal protein S18 acetylase RimI-like enzyme
MDDLTIRHGFTSGDCTKIAALWAQLGWGEDGAEGKVRVERALKASAWVAIAEVAGEFAGYARALSDGVVVTYLAEVAVIPAYRRRGVGGALIRSCLDAFPHTSVYADASPDAIGPNTRHGLLPRPSHMTVCARGPR